MSLKIEANEKCEQIIVANTPHMKEDARKSVIDTYERLSQDSEPEIDTKKGIKQLKRIFKQ